MLMPQVIITSAAICSHRKVYNKLSSRKCVHHCGVSVTVLVDSCAFVSDASGNGWSATYSLEWELSDAVVFAVVGVPVAVVSLVVVVTDVASSGSTELDSPRNSI